MSDRPSRVVVAVVDDDASVLRSLGYLLESADYAARLFTSASDFLKSGSLPEINCLISDIDMPDMDGFELVRIVAGIRPNLPAVLITGFPETMKRSAPLDRSRLRVFIKPFHGPELLAAITDVLRN